MPKPAHLDHARRQDYLYICRLQSLPCYREILRRLTIGQSIRSLALWLSRQGFDGACGAWTCTYWQKLVFPLAREIAKTKALQETAGRRLNEKFQRRFYDSRDQNPRGRLHHKQEARVQFTIVRVLSVFGGQNRTISSNVRVTIL